MRLLIMTLFLFHVGKGKVVNNFNTCRSFFYKNSPPTGFPTGRTSTICQRYNSDYHFATLYNKADRIPVYSAYTLDTLICLSRQNSRRSSWFLEPQLSGRQFTDSMATDSGNIDTHKRDQAINVDYPNTNFDRGHLNPSFYQCNDRRTATFTLTNAVPQDPCFNQQIWNQMEKMSKKIMEEKCSFLGAKRFFVTGAVPSNKKIPKYNADEESDRRRVCTRVSVPSIMWTAACCDSTNAVDEEDRDKGFSFGYYGDNIPDSYVSPLLVSILERKLESLYGVTEIEIFTDSCFSSSKNSFDARNRLAVPVTSKIFDQISSMSISSESSIDQEQKSHLDNVNTNMETDPNFANRNWKLADADVGITFFRDMVQATRNILAPLKMVPLLIKAVKTFSKRPVRTNENKYIIEVSNGDEYLIVPSKESTLAADGSRCRHGHACDYHGKSYQWCYTDWSNNWDYCCIDNCRFGGKSYSWCYASKSKHWAYCSQRASMVTVSGKHCRADHECGAHRKSYHWCYVDTDDNWDYCCQPWHTCDTNENKNYKWCYVGYKKKTKWKYCYY